MTYERNLQLKLAVIGNQFEIEEIRMMLDRSDLTVQVLSSGPLHMGMEEITLVLSILGTGASLIALLENLSKRRRSCEIQIKTEDNETISLRKTASWTLRDIRKLLKLEEED